MSAKKDFHAAATKIQIETRAFIDGKFVDAIDGQRFETVNPATGKVLAQVSAGGAADIDVAVMAARRSFDSGAWSRTAPRDRKKTLLRLADLVEKHADELALLEVLDNGKPITDAMTADLPDAIETLRWHAETVDKLYDQVSPTPHDISSVIIREPIGVVGAVIPWNFPLAITAMKIGPTLAAGNSLVIKPAEQTPLTALRLAGLAAEAGIPDGVLNVVPGDGPNAGQALGRHNDVDCLSFTGSTEVGRLFLKYAAESNLKRTTLELGGKSPAIVMDDVSDLKHVAEQVAFGILFSQGENCSAGSRLIVHRKIKDKLLAELIEVFKGWKLGDPLQPDTKIGAMIDEGHLKRVLSYIAAGEEGGAKLVTGGRRALTETGGYFLPPTLFDGVDNGMKIAREEIFGPVLSVITVADADEAIRIANDTPYGLAASLYTDNLHTAHKISRAVRAGTVSINCFSEGDQGAPFGGFKQSGFGGREKSLLAHDQYTEVKTIWTQIR